ncbi:MAG: hypothetical protein ABIW84_01225 [Ilumatobacteraceae bacterium]
MSRSVRRVPLPTRVAIAFALTTAAAACSSDTAPTTQTAGATLVPDPTALAPGACDPTDALPAPGIAVGPTTTPATLGVGDFSCGGINGSGYISFSYNPVLIDGEGSVTVIVPNGTSSGVQETGDEIIVSISWSGDQPFVESGSGTWTSTLDERTCARLTLGLATASGSSTATYGADIRSGGAAVPCPQRVIDPTDPGDADQPSFGTG